MTNDSIIVQSASLRGGREGETSLTSSTRDLCILVQHSLHGHASLLVSFGFSFRSRSRVLPVVCGGGGGTGGGNGLVATSRLSELELWRRGGVMLLLTFACWQVACLTSHDRPCSLPHLTACEGDMYRFSMHLLLGCCGCGRRKSSSR